MSKRVLGLLLAMAVLVMAGALLTQYRAEAKDGAKVVNFTLKDVNGKTVKLSQYRGKVVVVDMWATWCGYCVREMPDLIALQEKADKEGLKLQIIGVSVDDDKAVVKTFAKEHKLNYPVLYNNDKQMKPFGKVLGLPTKFIVNEKGEIVEKIIGAREAKELEAIIEKHLPKK